MKKLLPIILLLVGTGAGVGAGVALKPEPVDMALENPCGDVVAHEPHRDKANENVEEVPQAEYVELNNQFVIPVVTKDMVESLVVLSLGLEIDPGQAEVIYQREPKLRDVLLQVMFDHANIGGFRGRFTDGNNMDVLRLSLTEAAQGIVGDTLRGVIITDIARQDI